MTPELQKQIEEIATIITVRVYGAPFNERRAAILKELQPLITRLQAAEKWKEEDPRMLREQIRIADAAFNRLQEELNSAKQELENLKNDFALILEERNATADTIYRMVQLLKPLDNERNLDCAARAATERDQLRQSLAEAGKDKERLDYLDKHRTAHIYSSFKFNPSNAASQNTWREAIDAAIEQQKKGKEV